MQYENLKNILVVEDNIDIQELLRQILRAQGLDAKLAADGEAAIAILQSQKIDLLITDFRMPKLNGVELLAWCRNNYIKIPVIFMSAEADLLPDEQIALGDCCATMMRKPIDFAVFNAAIDAADKRHHHRDCIHGQAKSK